MISSNLHNIRSATVHRAGSDCWVTLSLAGRDRVAIHLHSLNSANAIASAINADANLTAAMASQKEAGA